MNPTPQEMVAMSSPLLRTRRSFEEVRKAYRSEGDELTLTSIQIRAGQHELIKNLAHENHLSQAAVMRQIIDDWCGLNLDDSEE